MAIKDGKVELTSVHIKKIFGLGDQDAVDWHAAIKPACDERQIDSIFRLSAFLAQVKVESGNLKTLTENLNYSASRLLQVFPKYFKSADEASQYANKPEKIANRVYGGRMGNGPESSGDGYKYRGRGCIQLTGKSNYEAATRGGVSCLGSNSDYLTTKEGAIRSAAWFWNSKGLNSPADQADIETVSRRVNGGSNGLDERKTAYQLALIVLSALPDGTTIDLDPADPGTANSNQLEVERKDPSAMDNADATHKSFQEPIVAGKSEYPWNQAFESRSGHLIEIDDTPGVERLQWYHRLGTYMEMQPDGIYSMKVVKDNYLFVNNDNYRDIKGDSTYKIGGQLFQKVDQDATLDSGGTITQRANKIQLDAPVVNAQETCNLPIINCQMIRMRPGSKSSGNVADLKARDANHADYADSAKWAVSAGGLAPGIKTEVPGAAMSGTWSRLNTTDLTWRGAVNFNPVLVDASRLGFNDEHDLLTSSDGDNITKATGDHGLFVNGDRVAQSGGDVIDHNLGDREIVAGETLTIQSDTEVIIKAPSVKFSPLKQMLFTPIRGVEELDPPSEENAGLFAVFVNEFGRLRTARSDGLTWQLIGDFV